MGVEKITPGRIYRQADGTLLIAETGDILRSIADGKQRYLTPDTELYAVWASTEWCRAMLNARLELLRKLHISEQARQSVEARYEYLGEALLKKAESHGWCEEYEEFAEEWDLPKRTKDFYVVVRMIVEATSPDEARTLAEKDPIEYEWDDVHVEEKTD